MADYWSCKQKKRLIIRKAKNQTSTYQSLEFEQIGQLRRDQEESKEKEEKVNQTNNIHTCLSVVTNSHSVPWMMVPVAKLLF